MAEFSYAVCLGETIMFRTNGYEVADVRNAKPEAFAKGMVNGEPIGGYIPVWCQRENREPTTIFVHVNNVVPLGN